MRRGALAGVALLAMSPGRAMSQAVETIIGAVGPIGEDGRADIDLRILNASAREQVMALPAQVDAVIDVAGTERPVRLERAAGTPASVYIAAREFAGARYRLVWPEGGAPVEHAAIAIPGWATQSVSFSPVRSRAVAVVASNDRPREPPANGVPAPSDRAAGNAFLDNLSAYEPIYAVYGPGTDSEARIQISFKYRLFGSRARQGKPPSVLDGLYFAYSQRMFWDLGAASSPFRNVDYQPELFYLTPAFALNGRVAASIQAGARHESNGRAGAASRSLNTIYVSPMAAVSLGSGYRLTLAPRLWVFAGRLADNPDIGHYRGNTGLFAEIGRDDGLRLSTSTRLNVASGKGSFAADLSYPLNRLLPGGPDVYLFGQSFVGYGENLLDYDRRTTRFRFGVALVR